MDIFFKPNIISDELILDPGESQHCIKVMRFKKGDRVKLVDGTGGYYTAVIIDDNYKACKILIQASELDYQPLPYTLEVAIAPTKNIDRFEWFLEKATEIGVSAITPILCQRSERKNIRKDRLEKVVIAAMKQSRKAYLPRVNPLIRLDEWVNKKHSGSRFVAHCMEGQKTDLWKAKLSKHVTILIGPEGDFSPEEIDLAMKNDFMPASLGNYRLRTETAGVVACSSVYFNFYQ